MLILLSLCYCSIFWLIWCKMLNSLRIVCLFLFIIVLLLFIMFILYVYYCYVSVCLYWSCICYKVKKGKLSSDFWNNMQVFFLMCSAIYEQNSFWDRLHESGIISSRDKTTWFDEKEKEKIWFFCPFSFLGEQGCRCICRGKVVCLLSPFFFFAAGDNDYWVARTSSGFYLLLLQ